MSLKEAERMWEDFQNSKPTPEELKLQGFDEVYFISGQRPVHIMRFTWQGLKPLTL